MGILTVPIVKTNERYVVTMELQSPATERFQIAKL
jgi:hypothetical protein